ncbi:transposase, partial [Dialister invisus]|uniref:transposase n=1 Tax=Dialister invisus TaxID=218538 RepID=UPI00265913E9
NKNTACIKAQAVAQQLREMKLTAAKKIETGIDETLTYMDYPAQHWNKIRTTNLIDRVNREIKRRTRVIGAFPDGQSALMLVCTRLRYIAGTDWGAKRYLNMQHLFEMEKEEINEQKSTG